MAIPRDHHVPISSTCGLRLLAIAIVGAIASSSAAAAPMLTTTGAYLFYQNVGPNDYVLNTPNPGGEDILFGADSVIPNGNAATNGVGVATTGFATTTNVATGAIISSPLLDISFNPSPTISPNFFAGALSLCTTNCTPLSNHNPINLTNPWTITFQNSGTSNGSTMNTLSLAGPGEIPFVNTIQLSVTNTQSTFSWRPPTNTNIDGGYRIQIYQNGIGTPADTEAGLVFSVNLTPAMTSYSVNTSTFLIGQTYTLKIEAITSRDGTSNISSNSNIAAMSQVFSTFQPLPAGTPPVNLGTPTLVGNQVIIGFNLTVEPGITYYLDPEVATGYVYQTGSGNPNFASVDLPNIGNPSPYEIYLWNGTSFVFDTLLAADTVLDFANGGTSEFEVLGIDPSLGLDPTNSTAFITALTFESAGSFTGTMTPVTTNVPEPPSLVMLVSGLLGLGSMYRCKICRRR